MGVNATNNTIDTSGFYFNSPRQIEACNLELVNYVIAEAARLGFDNFSQLSRAFKFSNSSKVLDSLNEFYSTGRINETYFEKLVGILALDREHIHALEEKHIEEWLKDIKFLAEHYKVFLDKIDEIISRKDFYNVKFKGLLMGNSLIDKTYQGKDAPLVFGELLTHWANDKFIDNNKCCAKVLIFSAAGSVLSGNHFYRGFCTNCKAIVKGSLSLFQELFRPHMKHTPQFHYEASNETIYSIFDAIT